MIRQAEGGAIEDRRIGVMRSRARAVMGCALGQVRAMARAWRRKSRTAASNAAGRLQVRQMSDAGQANVTGAGDLARHAFHHLRRRIAIMLAGKAKHGDADSCKVGALVEGDEAAHRRAVGVGRHRCHDCDRKRAPGRIRRGPQNVVDDVRPRDRPWSCRHRAAPADRPRTCAGTRRRDCRRPGSCSTAPPRCIRPAGGAARSAQPFRRANDQPAPGAANRRSAMDVSRSDASPSKSSVVTGARDP